MLIGNDLVDLQARDAGGKAGDDRFIRRVFTPGEAVCIRSSPDPDRALWMLWAGKEAAFKIARKLRPGIPFVHNAYEVLPADAPDPRAPAVAETMDARTLRTAGLQGSVRLRGVQGLEGTWFPVEWEVTTSFVHCVAVEAGPGAPRVWTAVSKHEDSGRALRHLDSAPASRSAGVAKNEESERISGTHELSERERASAHSAASFAVRRLARALAREAGLGAVEIVREPTGRSFGPPRLFPVGGTEPLDGWDLSLSHDGALAAAALSGPPAGLL